MNNIRQKNVIFGLRSNATQPYIRHDYVNQGLDCVELNANTVNNGFQQLLDNDLYAERRLQDLSVHMDGPKAYDENTIDSMPNGFKAYGDIKNSPCFDILHKVEFPIEQTVTKSAALLGGYGFVCEYGNTVFVGGNGKNAAYSEDVAGDSWHRLNDKDGNAVVANGFCRYGERLFFAADDGVYEMSSWVDYETSDADDYGKTRYALVRLNVEPLALNAVSYDSEGRRFMACLKDGGLAFGGFDMKKSVSRQDVVFREFLQYDGDETVTLHGRDVATFGNRDGVFGIVAADEGVAELQISAMYDIERSIPVGTSANRCREMQKFDGYTFVASDQGLYCIETSDFIISQPVVRICVTGNNMYVFCSGSPAAVYVVSEGLAVSGNVLTRQFNSGDAMLTSMTVTSGCVFNGRVFVGTTSGVYYFEISDVIIVKRLHAGSVIDVRSSYGRVSVAEQHALYIYKTNGDTTSTDTDMVKDLTQRPVASGSRVVRLLELDGVRYVVTNSAVYVETDTAKYGEYPGVAKDACAVTAPDGTKLVLICGTFGVRAYSAENCSFVKTIITGSEFEKLAVSDRTVAATCTDNTISYVNASTLNAAGSVYTAKTVAAPESGYNISSFVCNNGKSFNGIGLNGSNAHLYTYAENSELNPAGIPGMDSVTTIAATHNLRGYVYSGVKGGAQGVYVAMYEDVTDSDSEESVSAVYKTLAVGGKSGIVDNNNPLSADVVHYITSTGWVQAVNLMLSASVSDRGTDRFPLLNDSTPHTVLSNVTANSLAVGDYLDSRVVLAATGSGIYVSPDTFGVSTVQPGANVTTVAVHRAGDASDIITDSFQVIYGNGSGVTVKWADGRGGTTLYSGWAVTDTKIYNHRNDYIIIAGYNVRWYNPDARVNGISSLGVVTVPVTNPTTGVITQVAITDIVGYVETEYNGDTVSYYVGKNKIYLKNADTESGDTDEWDYKPNYYIQKEYSISTSTGDVKCAAISEFDGNGNSFMVLGTSSGVYLLDLLARDGETERSRDAYLSTTPTKILDSTTVTSVSFINGGMLCVMDKPAGVNRIRIYGRDGTSWSIVREITDVTQMIAGNDVCKTKAYYLKNRYLYEIQTDEDVMVTQHQFAAGETLTGVYVDGRFRNYGIVTPGSSGYTYGWVNESFNVYRAYQKVSGSTGAKSVASFGNFIVFVDTDGAVKYMKRSGMSYSAPVRVVGQDSDGFIGCRIGNAEGSSAELYMWTSNKIYSVYISEDTETISLEDVVADEDYTSVSPSLVSLYIQEPTDGLEFLEQVTGDDENTLESVTIGQLIHNDDYDGYYMFSATNMYTQSDNPTIMLSKNDDVTGQKLKLVIGENGHLISAGGSGVYDMTARQTLIASAVSDIVYAGKGMYFIKQGSAWNYVIGGMFGSVIPCTPLSGKGDVGSANFTDRTLTLTASGNLYAAEFVVDISLVMYGNAVTNLPEAQLLRIQESTGNSVQVIAERSGKQREYQFDLTLNDGLKLVTYDCGGEKHTDFDFIRYSGDSANSYVYVSMQPGTLLYGRSRKLMMTTPTEMAVGVNGVFQADGLEYWMYSDKNCIVVSHGYNQTATVAMLDPASVTQSKRIIEASSGKYVIQSDYGIQAFDDYTLYTVKENSGIRGLNSYNIDGTTKFVYVDGHDVYTSRNCKLWSKQFSLSARYSTVYDVKPLDLRTWLFLADTGTYYTKYDYQVVHDINSFTQEQALALYDELMSRRNTGISAQVSSALSNHISSEHSATSLVTQMNNDFLDTGMDGVLDWQRASGDSTDMDVMNDVVAEMTFGTSADGDLAVQARNFMINNEVSAVDLDFSYIMKRWMSGVTELYISIPTTHTYYLANVYGAGNCMVDSQTKYVRKNLSQFGTAVSEQDGDLTTHYTDIVIGVTSAEYHIDNMLDMQVNGNSLPLQIYKDTTQGGSNSLAGQLYSSFVEPSVMKGMQIDRTDEDGNYIFNAACFGSDAQAVRLMFYDSRARQNLPWVRIVFDPNGGEGSMSKQKFLINEDGTLERKPLKKCRFTNTSAGYMKIFAGWTLTPQADNYSWDSRTYTGGQIYEENQTFPYSQTVGAMMTELMRSSDEDFVRKEEITLYAVWLTYQFTAADTTLTLNSDQTRFAIDSVGVDTSTKLKNNVVINYGG